MNITIRPATTRDAAPLARIYNHYIRETVITFEEVEIADSEMAERIAKIGELSLPWLVAESEGAIVGYAYAGK
ncbi:MAG TPA: GNAT family N-acetyltransferase, partial [Gammaproteobacteria bacterium]|nr:GNAT family N-acetyltransferase [Gammaproteobacteria bacterium]